LTVGFWRGREGNERLGKKSILVWEFKKNKERFWGLILSNFKVPINWRVLEG
jgi:hypothetical protein